MSSHSREAVAEYIYTLTCTDRPGLVAAVSGNIFDLGGNILEAAQFNDQTTHKFFMRIHFASALKTDEITQALANLGRKYAMDWQIRATDDRLRVLLLVSRLDHCLADLLYRSSIGELPMNVVGVVSNHPRESIKASVPSSVPFYHFPVTSKTKTSQEELIKGLIDSLNVDLVVLARYMQILSNEFARSLSGRCINIHHAFLPSFKGAKPYHQAFERGVKIIGATAHYVTSDLDEGPIIVQDVEHITHADSPEDLVRKGRDIEQRVLARAVSYHLQARVLMNGLKTVVFRD